MATAKELRELTVDDLRRRAEELRQALFQDQLKLRTGTLDNPNERTQHRRDLVFIHTAPTEKTKAATPAARPESSKES